MSLLPYHKSNKTNFISLLFTLTPDLVLPRRPGVAVGHGALNKLKIEKSHPKGLMMSDFSCIFAMSLTQIYFFCNTNLV